MSKLLVIAAAAGLVLNACGRRNDSVHRDLKSKDAATEIQSAAVSSTDSSGQQSETSSESAAREAGSSTSSPVGNTASNSTATSSANLPSGLKLCGAPGNSCYQDDKAMAAGKAQLSDGSTISLVAASNGFKVWKDDASSKILKASGLFQGKDDWQKKLQPSGFGATPNYFTEFAGIAGRACPEMSYRAASVAPSPGTPRGVHIPVAESATEASVAHTPRTKSWAYGGNDMSQV